MGYLSMPFCVSLRFEDVVGRLSKPPEKKRAAEGNDEEQAIEALQHLVEAED